MAKSIGLLAMIVALPLQAQVIYNVDIDVSGNPFGTYTGPGVLGGGGIWNGVTGTGVQNISLLDSNGGASTVTLVTSGNTFADGRASTNTLLADYAYPDPLYAPGVFSLSGLASSGVYNLVLYGAYPQSLGFSTEFTVIGASTTSLVLVLDGQNETFVNGTSGSPGTYVQFNNIVATVGGTLTINYAGGPGSTDAIGITNGFQLQAVPEPSTWGFMILGFGGLLLLTRRTRTASHVSAK
jgi:hypothetical protein